MTVPAKIELKKVTKHFGEEKALDAIDLSINKGESVVVIGPSGSGKTILLKSILGLVHPESGSLLVDGEETLNLSDRKRARFVAKFGMLFQWSGLFDSLPVWENITFRLLQEKRLTRKQAKELAVEKVLAVGLDAGAADLFPADLSGGMQKRVGLARAIAAEPEIILLDEPTAGLDPIMSNVINELILDLVRDLGATAISVNSDMAGARKLADRIVMLHEGRLVWQGPVDRVDDSGNDYLDQFIHSRADGPIETITGVFH